MLFEYERMTPMTSRSTSGKILRLIAIVFMSLTAAFTLLGGVGTSCVAFAPNNPSWAEMGSQLASFQWLYILFVFVTVALGVMGFRAVVLLIKSHPNAYRCALIALTGGVVVGIIHMWVSRALRGKSMPVDAVVYTTVLTLLLFLFLRLPGIWQQIRFGQPDSAGTTGTATGASLIVSGVLALSIQYWMAGTHTFNGINVADVWHPLLAVIGGLAVLAGIAVLGWVVALHAEPLPETVTA
jgi:hypothetical protein